MSRFEPEEYFEVGDLWLDQRSGKLWRRDELNWTELQANAKGSRTVIAAVSRCDTERIVEMARQHWPVMYPNVLFKESRVREIIELALTSSDWASWVARKDCGALAGIIAVYRCAHFITCEPTAGVVWWFVAPEARGRVGLRLLQISEQWAHDHVGALSVTVHDEALCALLRRRGYSATDFSFRRAF